MTVPGRFRPNPIRRKLDQFGEKLQKDTVVVVSGQVSFDDFQVDIKMSGTGI